jgi:hypothetical protein
LRRQRAAGEALATLKDARALEALRKHAPDALSEEHRQMFKDWIEKALAAQTKG